MASRRGFLMYVGAAPSVGALFPGLGGSAPGRFHATPLPGLEAHPRDFATGNVL